MEDHEQAIIAWVNTFESGAQCTDLSQLSDGIMIADILNEIVPFYFEKGTMNTETAGNWALAAGNLRKLLRTLDGYFRTVLFKEISMNVDVNAIVKSNNTAEILNLLELVVGVAVQCDDKTTFIQNILSLDNLSQYVFKSLIEQVLARAKDIDENGEGDDINEEEATSMPTVVSTNSLQSDSVAQDQIKKLEQLSRHKEEQLLQTNAMVEHLQSAQEKLIAQVR